SDPWNSPQSGFIRVPFRIRCHSRSIPDPRCKGVPMSAEVAELLEQLRDPAAYPYPVTEVEVCQTHLSLAFLAGPFVYKVRKTIHFEFADFSTFDLRRVDCEKEVRLNRRLAPAVYRGVVPVTRTGGRLVFEGDGEPVDWAVKMQRLPAGATLREHLQRGTLLPEHVERL